MVPNACLLLDDGTSYMGNFIGCQGTTLGELCFNTALTGYQEVISDPSYLGQIVVFAFPHIGNVGTNSKDNESDEVYLKGIVIAEAASPPSNQRSEASFASWLEKNKVIGICNINTRNLVKRIRDAGRPMKCTIAPYYANNHGGCVESLKELLNKETGISGQDLTSLAQKRYKTLLTTPSKVVKPIVVLDFGVKKNILLELQTRGLETIILPGNASLEMILKQNPAGVVLSNGPGDPRSTIQPILPAIKGIIDLNIPLMGICLGFQLIGLALGGIIKQLVCGHHGTNHPIYDLKHKRTYISSQNHEFHLLIENIPSNIRPSFISLFDKTLEGFYVDNKPIIAVQFHPESNPGPHDCSFIFNQFKELVEKYAKAYGHK